MGDGTGTGTTRPTLASVCSASDGFPSEFVGLATSIEANTECVGEYRIGGLPPSCEALRLTRIASIARSMNSSTHDFVTVDMRGLKAALLARAQAERVSVSVVVRRAVGRELGVFDTPTAQAAAETPTAAPARAIVKLSIRLTSAEADQLDAGARWAGLSRGAFLAGLLANVPSLSGDASGRLDCLRALTASSAELSTLCRNIHHLTVLLRQGQVRANQEYRRMLDTLADDVRAHLGLAASVLAELRPARRSGGDPRRHAAS
jgi:hypothetical protein